MTIPADGTKVNFDSSTDDPRAARAEFVDQLDKFNVLLAHLRAAAFVANSYAVGEGVEINAAALRAKVRAAWGIGRDGNGLALDINGMGAFSGDVDPSADFIPVYDAGGSVASKAPPKSVLQSFTYLTELTAVDSAADKMPIYDASTNTLKWAKPQSLGAGSWTLAGQANGSNVSSLLVAVPATARYVMFTSRALPATNGANIEFRTYANSGPTVLCTVTATNVGNTSSDGGASFAGFIMDAQAGIKKVISGVGHFYDTAGVLTGLSQSSPSTGSTLPVNNVQVLASSGNVSGDLAVFYAV